MSGDTQPMTGAAIQGAVHGGQQPIVGATVQLWVVGSGSYGAAASALGSSVTTGAGGTFTIGAYTCPSSSALVYLTSSGGNPGLSASNPNIELAAALGACSGAASDTVIINEVTTAAAAYALGQYFTTTFGGSSTDSFGAPSTTQAQTGIANAFATVNNLVTFNTGAAVTSATLTNAGLTVTATPESAKLNTVADILAACVNSLGTSDPDGYCTALFADVAPTGATQPTDTLQAAVYMSLNPTSNNTNGSTANLTALYALQTGIAAPFVGVSSQPTDWTIGIQYTGSTPLNDPQNMAADASGNIWVINHNGTSLASLTELSPTGMPVVNASTIAGQNINALQPRNEAIDTNGNIWFDNTSSPSHFFEYNVLSPSSSIDVLPAGGGSPYGVAIDGSNNVFFTHESSSATATVEEFLGGTLSSSAEVEYALYSPGGTNQQPEYAAIDTSGNLWMTNGTSTSGLESNIFQMSAYNGSTACTVFPCVASTAGDTTLTQTYTDMVSASGGVPALSEPYGVAAGTAGTGVWLGNQTGNTVTNMTSTTAGTNYGSATSLNKPQYVAIDGAGNVWVSNGASSSNGSVSEFAGTGAGVGSVLSPVNSGTAPFTAIGFTHSGINTAEGITIDPSGNVWTAGQVATTGGVFEIVGAAAPTVTPISLALKNSAVGKKP
ncbi:MAG: hypothetical protein ABR910_04040 [Acidobacteriaceae bacterium]